MRKLAFVFTLLAIAAMSFSQFAAFSCESTKSFGGRSFAAANTPGALIGTCQGTTERLNNINIISYHTANLCTATPSLATISGGIISITGYGSSAGCSAGGTGHDDDYFSFIVSNISIPNNTIMIVAGYSVLTIGGQHNCFYGQVNGNNVGDSSTSCSSSPPASTITFTRVNSTCSSGSINSPSATFTVCDGQYLNFTNIGRLEMPKLNITGIYEFASNTAKNFTPLDFRLTYENGGSISKAWGNGTNLTSFDTFTTANTFSAVLVEEASVMLPRNIWYPGATEYAYARAYSNVTTLTTVKNNTAAYVYDDITGVWYFCPPVPVPGNASVYTITCVFAADTAATSYTLNASMVFLQQNCWQSGNTFYWNIKSTDSQTYMASASYSNSTIINTAGSGLAFIGNASTINATNITIYYGNNPNLTICGWSNNTFTLLNGNSQIFNDYNTTRQFGQLFLYFTVGTGIIFPPALIGTVVINDTFMFLTAVQMMGLVVIATLMSMIILYSGDKTMKMAGIYVAVGLALVAWITVNGIMPQIQSVSDLTTAFQAMPTTISSNDLVGILKGSFDLLFKILLFIFTVPVALVDTIVMPLSYVSLNLYNAVSGVSVFVKIGIYIYLALKIIEVVSNRFRPI